MLSRRRLLLGAAAVPAVAAYPFVLEPRWIEVTRRVVPVRSLRGCARIRILQLSDLHASHEIPLSRIAEAIRLGLETRPDLICLTGDYITRQMEVDPAAYVDLLRRLPAAAPTFATFGNHDGGAWARQMLGLPSTGPVREVLEAARIRVLHNARQVLELKGARVTLTGLGDLWAREMDPAAAFAGPAPEGPRVVLSHNPDTKDPLRGYAWDLMLSGHTHGGQVVLPFYGPPIVPVRDRRFVQGLHRWDGRHLQISRGVGGILAGMRLGCRPEVSVVDLAPESWEACSFAPGEGPGE